MITCRWLKNDQIVTGNHQLIEQWRASQEGTLWVDLQGEEKTTEKELLLELGCHPLAVQYAQRDRHPPKVEQFKQHLFLLYRGIESIGEDLDILMQSLSVFINDDLIITTRKSASLEIDKLIANPELKKLINQPIQLLSQLMIYSAMMYTDSMLDVEESITDLEEQMTIAGDDELLMSVSAYRTQLRKFRRVFAYHENMLARLLKSLEHHDGDKNTLHAVQDTYDKFERLLSLSSLYYDLCGDLSDAYLSLSSHRLNRTMQVLTVITAIFVPLSFLVGLYGMNFEYIPELKVKNGYFFLLGFMGSMALTLLLLFKKKRWL